MRPVATIKVERGIGIGKNIRDRLLVFSLTDVVASGSCCRVSLVVNGGGVRAIHVLVQVPNRSTFVLFARPTVLLMFYACRTNRSVLVSTMDSRCTALLC